MKTVRYTARILTRIGSDFRLKHKHKKNIEFKKIEPQKLLENLIYKLYTIIIINEESCITFSRSLTQQIQFY